MAAEDSDIALIDPWYKLLTSREKIICKLAWDELNEIANWRFGSTSSANINVCLNSKDFLDARSSDKYKSTWSRPRQASKHIMVVWAVNDRFDFELDAGDGLISGRRAIFRNLRLMLRKNHTLLLRAHPHQVKTNECVAASKASFPFFSDGSYNAFKDWRFVHRARLCLVPLNAYNHVNKPKKWRRCQKDETLPFVLNRCMVYSTMF